MADACGPCGAQAGCGWCATSGQCLRGDARGPVEGTCISPTPSASPASAFESWGETNPVSGSPWSWGYADGAGAFHAFEILGNLTEGVVRQWRRDSRTELAVSRNIGGWVHTLGAITFPAQEWLHLHPGPARESAVARWTAPSDDTFLVDGAFKSLRTAPFATVDAHVTINDLEVFTAEINDGTERPFHLRIRVRQGDRVDFSVGVGLNLNYNADSTGLRALVRRASDPIAAPAFRLGAGACVERVESDAGANDITLIDVTDDVTDDVSPTDGATDDVSPTDGATDDVTPTDGATDADATDADATDGAADAGVGPSDGAIEDVAGGTDAPAADVPVTPGELSLGGSCDASGECRSALCANGVCACIPRPEVAPCALDANCCSGRCADGRCACVPRCEARQCGPDGCGGQCGQCAETQTCNTSGQCVTPPASGCTTSATCGACAPRSGCGWCSASSRCLSGTQSGPTGGSCSSGWRWLPSECPSGTTCTCSGRSCGPNSCGAGSCGTCASGRSCNASGQCVTTGGTTCTSNAACGTCTPVAGCGWCSATSRCVSGTASGPVGSSCASGWRWLPAECSATTCSCAGRACGPNSCGAGSCGTCASGQTCSSGTCTGGTTCNCTGRRCGPNSCGTGSCGTCASGQTCSSGTCTAVSTCTSLTACVTGTQNRPTGAGHCAGEITMTLRNGCGRAAYCQFRLSDGRGAGGTSVAAGATVGGELGGIWSCGAGSSVSYRYVCSAAENAHSCSNF